MSVLQLLSDNGIRPPETFTVDDQGVVTVAWTPPLTAPQQAIVADLQIMWRFGVTSNITLAEFQAMKSDLALGKAFLGIASPTLAQNNAATKALIRVVGALLRS